MTNIIFSQNSYFKNYRASVLCCETKEKKFKKDVLKEAFYYKKSLTSKIDTNQIALNIQRDINDAKFDFDKTYNNLSINLDNSYHETLKNYIKCCMILAKHTTNSSTKINWFGFTNKTTSINQLCSTDKKVNYVKSQPVMTKVEQILFYENKTPLAHYKTGKRYIDEKFNTYLPEIHKDYLPEIHEEEVSDEPRQQINNFKLGSSYEFLENYRKRTLK